RAAAMPGRTDNSPTPRRIAAGSAKRDEPALGRRTRVRPPGQACRHGAADVFQVSQRCGALERTRFRAQQLDFEAPEQSLKLLQPAVTQLGAGDHLRHPFLLSVARPRRSGPFLRPRVTIDREGLSDGGLTAAQDREKRRDKASPARCGYRRREDKEAMFGDERGLALVTRTVDVSSEQAGALTRLVSDAARRGGPLRAACPRVDPDRRPGAAGCLPSRSGI